MDIKGDDTLLNTSRITEWNVNHGGFLSVLFGGCLMIGCLVSYAIAVLRGNVDPYLPMISDAAGSPPQNGIFGTIVCIGGIIGVFFMLLRYMIVMEQNQDDSNLVKTLNNVSLGVGIISLCGITLITGYPINFYRDRDVWLKYVGIPHMMGGVILFSLGLIYAAIQCVLTLFLRSKHMKIFFLRTFLCLGGTVAFVYHLVTVPENIGHIVSMKMYPNINNLTNSSYITVPTRGNLKLPIEMTESYISSAIAQWTLVLLFCLFFFTFFSEGQEYSLQIIIETQSNDAETSSEVASDIYRFKDGPSSYVRKTSHAFGITPLGVEGLESSPDGKSSGMRLNTRRDSSCQTRLDFMPIPKISVQTIDEKVDPLKTQKAGNGTNIDSEKDVLENGSRAKCDSSTSPSPMDRNGELVPNKKSSPNANVEPILQDVSKESEDSDNKSVVVNVVKQDNGVSGAVKNGKSSE